MRWSFAVGRIGETVIKVHVTFLLLVAWYAWGAYVEGGMPSAIRGTAFLLSLFGCVLLHEFGHIRMARRFGVRTPDVVLLPIGGLARLERIPEEPKQEFLIALAGPLVTLVLCGAFALVVRLQGLGLMPGSGPPWEWSLPLALFAANAGLLVFNLIPAFPMDGGRLLRAVLASRLGLGRATEVAAGIGRGFAMLFGLWGLMNDQLVLVLVAVFIFLGATGEAQSVQTRIAGRGLTVGRMMVTRFDTLPVHATLQRAVDLLLAGDQREFPIVDNFGRLEGLLTRDHLIRALTVAGPSGTVGEAMAAGIRAVPPDLGFDEALAALRESGLPALPVTDASGALVGLLTLDNLSDLLLVRRASPEGGREQKRA